MLIVLELAWGTFTCLYWGGGEELNRDHHFLDPNARQSRPGMAGEPGS